MMTLVLMLSFGGSLRRWRDAGILSRELELYLEYLRRGLFERVVIYSYGSTDEAVLAELDLPVEIFGRIEIVGPEQQLRGLGGRLAHSFDIAHLKRAAAGAMVCKTNQISGSWSAIVVRLLGVPLFVRCGYILSRRHWLNRKYGAAVVSTLLEGVLFNAANLVSVTTADAAAHVRKAVFRKPRIFVAPTYVDTEVFCANAADKPDDDTLVYVGRLEPQKNLASLIEACAKTGASLQIIGDGSLRETLKALAAKLGAKVEFTPSLQNTQIAALYRSRRYFVLPSLHEGLPKALIEAMAAEMICIGTAIPGTMDLLRDGETGFLARDTGADAIAAAITRARTDPRRNVIARQARRLVLANHSLPGYADREFGEIMGSLGRSGESS